MNFLRRICKERSDVKESSNYIYSLRSGSNSDILAKECERGAIEAGHDVTHISLKGKEIKYCIGCLTCINNSSCILKDDVADIMGQVKESEVIIFATPIYYYEMCTADENTFG